MSANGTTSETVTITLDPAIHQIPENANGNTLLVTWKRVDNAASATEPTDDFEGVSSAATEQIGNSKRVSDAGRRHSGQLQLAQVNLAKPKQFPNIEPEYCFRCYETDAASQDVRSINGEPVFQKHLYLFNIIVALEWKPSSRTIQELRIAARRASNLLFDITDGYMAIGQVLIVGPELMEVADIQVMASNRLHPRAWVAALHLARKFQPIRVGRGLWRKNHNFVITWDQPDGYRAIVHEWGHYALGLADDYLSLKGVTRSEPNQRVWKDVGSQGTASLAITAPNIGLAVESIMSTLDASEIIPQGKGTRAKRRECVFERIGQYFSHVDPKGDLLEGPTEIPLAVPSFPELTTATKQPPEEFELDIDDYLRSQLQLESDPSNNCWVYVLKQGATASDPPAHVIAQGTLVAQPREDSFRLLGAANGDSVVIMRQLDSKPHVLSSVLRVYADHPTKIVAAKWNIVTPDDEDLPMFVDVLPQALTGTKGDQPPQLAKIQVQIEGHGAPPQDVRIYHFGQVDDGGGGTPVQLNAPEAAPESAAYQWKRWRSEAVECRHLDGHVLLRWNVGDPDKTKLLICSFSQGGGPGTSGGGYLPITAGSSEGNVMVFFLKNVKPIRLPGESSRSDTVVISKQEAKEDPAVRIITTTLIWGAQQLDSQAEARSYVFSLASNASLQPHPATLVLYFDEQASKVEGEPLVHRWHDDTGWERLTTYTPPGQQYVGVPLDPTVPEAAGRLIGASPLRFERYRIYWTP